MKPKALRDLNLITMEMATPVDLGHKRSPDGLREKKSTTEKRVNPSSPPR